MSAILGISVSGFSVDLDLYVDDFLVSARGSLRAAVARLGAAGSTLRAAIENELECALALAL